MDLITIVIPAFNAEKYVREAIISALAQSYPRREVIVVDDGSTDGTPAILEQFQADIRIVRQENQGCAAACNAGVAAARGTWVAFLDADDAWLPDKLALQMARCADYAISHTDSMYFGESVPAEVRSSSFEPPYSGWVLERLLIRNFITKSSVLIRREIFERHGGFSNRYPGVEDWPFWLSVCAENELGYLSEAVVRYRVHRKSKSMETRKTLTDHLKIIDEAFGPGGVGASLPHLRRRALASSYEINSHYAASAGDWKHALYCAAKWVQCEPTSRSAWKRLARIALIPAGFGY